MSFVQKDPRRMRTPEETARIVHGVSVAHGRDDLATVMCLMCIDVESDYWCPWNAADTESQQYQHDSQSDDNRSVGYYQQQKGPQGQPWWGTTEQMMTLPMATETFQSRLPADYRRAAGNPALAGEMVANVQRPAAAFRGRYATKWDESWELFDRAVKGEKPVGWSGDPVWLEEVLRPALGDRLKTLEGWQQAGHGDFKDIRGVMWHHTGNSRESAESIRRGRPDLEGPLANLHIDPKGIVTIVAVGVCWHAGQGSYPWLPTNAANQHMIGVECAWPTIRPDGSYNKDELWSDAQILSMRDTAAALTVKLGHPATRNIGHKEYAGSAQGKWDPGNLDMPWFRGEVAKKMRGEFDVKPPPTPVDPVPPPILPPPPNPRTDRVLLEETWDQLRGPGGRGWKQLEDKTVVDKLAEMDRKLDAIVIMLSREQGS